jgi:uncharacterized protein (TIGR02594 family)
MRSTINLALATVCIAVLVSHAPVSAKPSQESASVSLPKAKPKQISAKPAKSPKPAQAAKNDKKKKPAQTARIAEQPRTGIPANGERRVEQVRVAYASTELAAKRPSNTTDLIAEARKYLGTNPTDSSKLWCARFMNFVLARLGYAGTGSDAAKSFAYYGRRISEPRVGAIAVLTRGKNGGHVGIVTGIDQNGNPMILSGNHNKRVGEGVYNRARVIAYVMPTERRAAGTQVASISRAGEGGLDSPIAELIAAIQNEREDRRPASRPAEPAVPHRTIEQTSQPQLSQAAGRNTPLEPWLADILGVKQAPQQQPAAQPQRQQRVQQTPRRRVASLQVR